MKDKGKFVKKKKGERKDKLAHTHTRASLFLIWFLTSRFVMNIEPRPEEHIVNVRFKRNLLNYERGDEIFSNVMFGWMGKILYAETKWNDYSIGEK